ncbi:MAG: GNAT family N-acetyltransferase [Chloroflexi bacterium]|nr:GNAT family N-acetyltransferase [Chloroflexota bacterium]
MTRRVHRPPESVALQVFDPAADHAFAEALLDAEFGGRVQARRGELMDPLDAAGLVAEVGGQPVGLVTWVVGGALSTAHEAEIRVLVVARPARRRGLGGVLLEAAVKALAAAGVERAWLVTTNDNLEALGFYQRRGWRLSGLSVGAVDEARRILKPAIAPRDPTGIPIRDELILEHDLEVASRSGMGSSGAPLVVQTSRLATPGSCDSDEPAASRRLSGRAVTEEGVERSDLVDNRFGDHR